MFASHTHSLPITTGSGQTTTHYSSSYLCISIKILTRVQVLAYIYITVNFQLRSSIHAGLMERSLYAQLPDLIYANLTTESRWVFWGFLGGGATIFGGNPPRNAMTTDLRRLVKKLWRYCKYPSLYMRQSNYKKKHLKNGMSMP